MTSPTVKQSLQSKWVQHELNAGLARELEKEDVFILPLFLSGVDEMLPAFLKDKIYADVRRSYDEGFTELLSSITGSRVRRQLERPFSDN